MKEKRSIGRILGTIGCCLLITLAFVGYFAAAWYVRVYGRIGFDSVIYTLSASLGGVQSGLILEFLKGAALPAAIFSLAICCLLFLPWKKWGINWKIFPFKRWLSVTLSIVLSLSLLTYAAFDVELVDYIGHMLNPSELYQKEYRDPEEVTVRFPEEKRNLIYIMLESMETSYLDKAMGGALSYNLIPELTALAQENINFSHNDTVGGFREVSGASWTIGAMTAHTSGIPLKTPDTVDDWQNGYGKDGVFLPGLDNLTTMLKEEGYNQALMVGSNAAFGGRKAYYESHGVDAIYDIYTARQEGIVPYNYFVWWGMEDLYLFDYAQQKITEMAQKDEPFAFTMLTVDTHHIGGYKCELCGSDHEENYENVISCASRQVAAFVQWIQAQPFYENTTVIITGDHCSMDKGYFSRNVEDGYTRHIYNCFINAAAEPSLTQNRQFSAVDMFPTTLAAMGCQIEGERLGLGVNLFSNQPTLMERMGFSEFNTQLARRSEYYERFYNEKVPS